MSSSILELNCIGMQCPAPILEISRAVKNAPRPLRLEVRANDSSFAGDVQAWCRSTGALLESLDDTNGTVIARISLGHNGEKPQLAVLPAPQRAVNHHIEIDCRGMLCPEPILHISRIARETRQPTTLVISADDAAFPLDIEAWCRSTGASIVSVEQADEHHIATVKLHNSRTEPSRLSVPPPPSRTAQPSLPPKEDLELLDLRGQVSELALLSLGQLVLDRKQVRFLIDPGPIERHLRAWGKAISAHIEFVPEGDALRGWAVLEGVPKDPSPQNAPVRAEVEATGAAIRKNKAALLVLHNDFEPLMAALMVANTSAAQGMEVEIYFSFWGVNLLRAPRGSTVRSALTKQAPLLKRVMKRMMPAGPDALPLSKMNMGGIGAEMMKYFMRSDNILGVRQLMEQAEKLGVKFVVCSMSMGLMGIDQADLLELPNLSFGGVTMFTAAARESSLSLVF